MKFVFAMFCSADDVESATRRKVKVRCTPSHIESRLLSNNILSSDSGPVSDPLPQLLSLLDVRHVTKPLPPPTMHNVAVGE
jgi:hypothetical protein